MALTSPALTLGVHALFGNVTPALDIIKKLGVTDFSDGADGIIEIKPGATIKVPVSSVSKALAYNETSNNYLTGGATDWASLSASHFVQGYDITGVNVDQGADAAKFKQLFSLRAGQGIAMAAIDAAKTALDGATTSTGVTLSNSADYAAYAGLGSDVNWLNKATSILAVKGSEWAAIVSACAAKNVVRKEDIVSGLGFADIVVIPGMTARAVIVPAGAFGVLGRVPATVARYMESGVETDEESGLSVGIKVANDQAHNRIVCNADIWFGATLISANAAATSAGVIKVGTGS